MIVDEFLKLLGEQPHKAEEILQRPDCPIDFKRIYLGEVQHGDEELAACDCSQFSTSCLRRSMALRTLRKD